MRRLAVIIPATLAILLGAAVASQAQPPTNPLAPGIPQQTPTFSPPTTATPTVVGPTTTSGSGGLSGSAAVAIGIGALVVLGGISFFIWHDARRRAPVRHRLAAAAESGRSGTQPRPKPRKLSPAERRRRKRGRAR